MGGSIGRQAHFVIEELNYKQIVGSWMARTAGQIGATSGSSSSTSWRERSRSTSES